MNDKLLSAVLGRELIHMPENTSLNPTGNEIVFQTITNDKIGSISESAFTFKLIDWAFELGYMLSLYKNTDGSFEESDYTCSVFVPHQYDIDFVSDKFFDSACQAGHHILESSL